MRAVTDDEGDSWAIAWQDDLGTGSKKALSPGPFTVDLIESLSHQALTEGLERLSRRDWPQTTRLQNIEVFYNRERRHSTLGQRSPADYEKMHLPAIAEEQAA